jgi:tRNA wybutosine-synthesizing protein 1
MFCWRFQGFSEVYLRDVDEPEFIVEESIRQQRRLITGYKGDPRVDPKKWEEAMEPRHVAISLIGEPTLYPRLGELIEEYHKRGFTTFLVTNGTMPEVLESLDPLPTQLYVTVAAPNKEIYSKLLVPLIKNGWERLNRTLELLPSLDTRKVIRHTLVKGWNMEYVDEYAKLDMVAEPDFIEPKAYVFVGYSRERLTIENMPSHEEIRQFSREMAELTGYHYIDEKEDSRVVLLSKNKNPPKISI